MGSGSSSQRSHRNIIRCQRLSHVRCSSAVHTALYSGGGENKFNQSRDETFVLMLIV